LKRGGVEKKAIKRYNKIKYREVDRGESDDRGKAKSDYRA